MFAIGRMPGWIANFKEILEDPKSRIYRPRQVFTGPTNQSYVPMEQRLDPAHRDAGPARAVPARYSSLESPPERSLVMPDAKCVFCEIVAGRAPAHVVHEDERSLCLLDIHPFTKGHCLVVSKRHVQFWHELEPEENQSLFQVARTVADRMVQRLEPDFVCLYSRGGASRTPTSS